MRSDSINPEGGTLDNLASSSQEDGGKEIGTAKGLPEMTSQPNAMWGPALDLGALTKAAVSAGEL